MADLLPVLSTIQEDVSRQLAKPAPGSTPAKALDLTLPASEETPALPAGKP